MTQVELRRLIKVDTFEFQGPLMIIKYWRKNRGQYTLLSLCLSHSDYLPHLEVIGSIDEIHSAPLGITVDGGHYSLTEYIHNFPLSQWEALNIVIRHELMKETQKDVALLEMDAAIDALK